MWAAGRMKARILWFVAVVVVLAVLATLLLWQFFQPRVFVLEVSNDSDKAVAEVRVFGSAVEHELTLQQLLPGARQQLTTPLLRKGELRFEVSQGLNRIDTFIAEDVALLEKNHQRLIIHNNSRFIIEALAAQ